MKKIRLNADDLKVLSFATAAQPEVRGTIRAAGRTGYTCYETVARDQWTNCLAYYPSYWGEDTCGCPLIPDTDPRVCPVVLNTADVTCMTCPGIHPGC